MALSGDVIPCAPRLTVLDWGVGGVDLFAKLRAARPDIALRYRSDSGFTPWGRVPTAALRRRIAAILDHEQALGATGVLVACNAASTVLPALCRDDAPWAPHGVHGVIDPGVAAALSAGWRHVGLVGGARTVRSGAWARPLRAADLTVRQVIAQPLSARIEAGDIDGPATRALVRQLCAPLRRCEAVILACTHYPAAAAAFNAALPGVLIFDPADAALQQLLAALPLPRPAALPAPPPTAWTTGDPAATRAAALRAFGVDLGAVGAVALHPIGCPPMTHPQPRRSPWPSG